MVTTWLYRAASLPPFFQNRVMSSSRPDYAEYVTGFGLDPSVTEPFTLLAVGFAAHIAAVLRV